MPRDHARYGWIWAAEWDCCPSDDGWRGPTCMVSGRTSPFGLQTAALQSRALTCRSRRRRRRASWFRLRIAGRSRGAASLLAGHAGGLVERGANPVVLAAGVQASEELRERAMPAITATVGGSGGDGLPQLWVVAANERDGRLRAGFGDDLVGPLLIRSDVRLPLVDGVDLGLCAPQHREQP